MSIPFHLLDERTNHPWRHENSVSLEINDDARLPGELRNNFVHPLRAVATPLGCHNALTTPSLSSFRDARIIGRYIHTINTRNGLSEPNNAL
jgi:hypothetical protein